MRVRFTTEKTAPSPQVMYGEMYEKTTLANHDDHNSGPGSLNMER
jgi:hypothetical protein